MSSPLRIYYSQPDPEPDETIDRPEESAFNRTLRAYAKKQQLNLGNGPQLAVVPEPKRERTRVVGTPLTRGGSAALPEPVEAEPEPQPAEVAEEKPSRPQPAGAGLLGRAWTWLQKSNKFTAVKQLRVSETVSLGEKRFVALVNIEGQKFLIGGGSSGVSLLTQLGTNESSTEALQSIAAAAGQSK